jgi:CrcB protein
MTRLLLVGIGGFTGSIARYWLSGVAQAQLGPVFPWGTLAVNVLGCFAIGALAQLAELRGGISTEAHALLVVGFLGGFTTFSAFGNDTLQLLRAHGSLLAASNVAAQIVLGLGAVWAGRSAAQLFGR